MAPLLILLGGAMGSPPRKSNSSSETTDFWKEFDKEIESAKTGQIPGPIPDPSRDPGRELPEGGGLLARLRRGAFRFFRGGFPAGLESLGPAGNN